jgi:hypothetical protein
MAATGIDAPMPAFAPTDKPFDVLVGVRDSRLVVVLKKGVLKPAHP